MYDVIYVLVWVFFFWGLFRFMRLSTYWVRTVFRVKIKKLLWRKL